ncbi:MAG TPA: hypothetical protein VF484_08245, partial [Candidatus Limnocylindrales bacterium]
SGPDRARFGQRWRVVQALFVDDPATAVQEADDLIAVVMRARGYPVGDFEQRAADISVNHPQVVDHYRTAHRIAERRATSTVDTEQLRQAFVHYRALFADLLETDDADRPEGAAEKRSRGADERSSVQMREVTADGASPASPEPPRTSQGTADARAAEVAATRRGRTSDAADPTIEPVEPARRP